MRLRSLLCMFERDYVQLTSTEVGQQSGGCGSDGDEDNKVEVDIEKFDTSRCWNRANWVAQCRVFSLFLVALVPSFLQPPRWNDEPPSTKKLSRVAWLDGLRGIAAFFVVCHHSSLLLFSWDIHRPYHTLSGHIIQLPILRLIVSGFPNVCIFFVISGYSISLNGLALAYARRYNAFQGALASSVARRHPRLFVPALIVSFTSALWSYWGWFADTTWNSDVAFPVRRMPQKETLWGQLLHWAGQARLHADPMSHNVNGADLFTYDINQWTMPVEFAGSMIVFLLLGALSRCKPIPRLLITTGVLLWQLYVASYAPFLFIGGMFLADMRLYVTQKTKHSSMVGGIEAINPDPEMHTNNKSPSSFGERLGENLKAACWMASFLGSFYLLSAPEIDQGIMNSKNAPGYKTLQSLVPQQYWDSHQPDHFLIPLGAFFLILSIDCCKLLQCIFTTNLAQYLGRISFSLYLVHGPLLYTLSAYLAPRAFIFTGGETDMEWSAGVMLVYLAFWPVAIWYADLVCRFVDESAVENIRYLYRRAVGE